ncbi:MAG: 3'(2'),5'-bisphosphate nucleotidase CysQ [Kangiellaceae bacterium]|jgi:3'(2'), 5'-bisphosphate nucleotidase|nr:3'(2'),5'-bisphosphate nucleotidase CysQ [Kangiellaceae bacterium]
MDNIKQPVEYIDPLIALSRLASNSILDFYQKKEIAVSYKANNTPLTEADIASHRIISDGLEQLTPDVPIISEESKSIAFLTRRQWSTYWLIDPLDGTREFIERSDQFSTNIALIVNHRPVVGVIFSPVDETCYYAAKDHGAYKFTCDHSARKIYTRSVPIVANNPQYTIVVSSRYNKQRIANLSDRLGSANKLIMGSSLKMCLIAEGKADLYPRFGPTGEWDTAAAHIILQEAGGLIETMECQPLEYNRKESLINPSFYAVGDTNMPWHRHFFK